MKDTTALAKSLTDAQLADIVKKYPARINREQSILHACKAEQRRRRKPETVAGFSAKRCAERLDRSSEND